MPLVVVDWVGGVAGWRDSGLGSRKGAKGFIVYCLLFKVQSLWLNLS